MLKRFCCRLVMGDLFWYWQILDEKSSEPLWVEAEYVVFPREHDVPG